jgi:hypothetical protein
MGQSVKLADDVMDAVRRESEMQSRSIAGQIVHWLNIGRAIERSPSFDYARVRQALSASRSPDSLSGEEQEIWAAEFAEQMTVPAAGERAFHAERHRLGRGVGLDDDGTLITRKATSKG